MEKKHIEWIDYIKGVCILCVMIHHAQPLDIWERLLAPFFLSAFFFVSGYTFTSKNGFRNFIIKKTRALVIPLVSLSLINGIVGVLFKGIPLRNRIMNLILEVAPNNDTLWFFACLFSASILFYAVNQMVQSSIGIIIVSNILSASGLIYIAGGGKGLLWQFELALISLTFMAWGYGYRRFENRIRLVTDKHWAFISASVVYVVLCLSYNNPVDMHMKEFGNIPVFFLSSFIGTMCIVMICQRMKNVKVLSYLGSHSIIYFAFQGFLMDTIRKVLLSLGITDRGFLCLICVTIALPFLTIASEIIYRFFPCLIGKASFKENLHSLKYKRKIT